MDKKFEVKDLDYDYIVDLIINPLVLRELFESFGHTKYPYDLKSLIENRIKDIEMDYQEQHYELAKSKVTLKELGLWDDVNDRLKNPITAYYHADYKYKKDYFTKNSLLRAIEIQLKYWKLILSEIMKKNVKYTDALIQHINMVRDYNSEMKIKKKKVRIVHNGWQDYDGGFYEAVDSEDDLLPIDIRHNKLFCPECNKWIDIQNDCSLKHFCNPRNQSGYMDFYLDHKKKKGDE